MTDAATSLSSGTPAAEFTIDEAFVSRLLADQHPDLAHLPLRVVDAGWDNAMFRLGGGGIDCPRTTLAALSIKGIVSPCACAMPRWETGARLPVPMECLAVVDGGDG